MNRRNLLKTAGLAIAGSAILPFDVFGKSTIENESHLKNDNLSLPISNKRKLGTQLS